MHLGPGAVLGAYQRAARGAGCGYGPGRTLRAGGCRLPQHLLRARVGVSSAKEKPPLAPEQKTLDGKN